MNIKGWIGVLALCLATPSFANTTTYLQYDVRSDDGLFWGELIFNNFLESESFSGGDVISDLVAWKFYYRTAVENGVTTDDNGYDNGYEVWTVDENTHPALHSGSQFFAASGDSGPYEPGEHLGSYICVSITGACAPSNNSPDGKRSTGYSDMYGGMEDMYFFNPQARNVVVDGITVSGPTVIPVPAAVWLFGSGLLGLVGIARRKKTA